MEEVIKRLDALLKEGRTEDVLGGVNDILHQEWKIFSPEHLAELHALRGMAYYRRKNFEDARTDFRFSLGTDPKNERAIYGMAYLAAYVDTDSEKFREWMEKLPDSAARDNAWMTILRSPEYYNMNQPLKTEGEAENIIEKWLKPNPGDPLNVANIMHNGGRFCIVAGDKTVECFPDIPPEESIYCYVTAVGLLNCAIGLYGTGNTNLHHRAEANYWMSIALEKIFGPAAALASAEQSVDLWSIQLALDPQNPNYKKNLRGAIDRYRSLKDAASELR